eukprot:9875796-Alexandrium_andersonii.AAC.1
MLHEITAGAIWTSARKMQAAVSETDRCPRCDALGCTPEHLWWECPAFAAVRGAGAVAEATRSGRMPLCLSGYGAPPA